MFQTAKNFVKASRLSRDASHSRKRILVLSLSLLRLCTISSFELCIGTKPLPNSVEHIRGSRGDEMKLRRHGMLEVYHVFDSMLDVGWQ